MMVCGLDGIVSYRLSSEIVTPCTFVLIRFCAIQLLPNLTVVFTKQISFNQSVMKKQLRFAFPILFCLATLPGMAQVGIGTTTPDPSAQLEIKSTSKGLLVPRVASTGDVPTPAEGLLVYQTSDPVGFYVRKGGVWVRMATANDISSPGGGTIIPYASGSPISIRGDQVSILGFGNSSTVEPDFVGRDFFVDGVEGDRFAFSVPRNGTVTSLAARFVASQPTQVYSPFAIIAELYSADVTSTFFSPAGASVVLEPRPPGFIQRGDQFSGILTGLNIPVTAQTRLLLVFRCRGCAPAGISVIGHANAGVSIN